MVQWSRICLPMQETWLRSLIREDSTCPGAIKPVPHNYWACALEPVLCNKRSHYTVRSLSMAMKSNPCSWQLEKASQQRRPSSAKNKWINIKRKKSDYEKIQKFWTDVFPKKTYGWSTSTWKTCSASLIIREIQIKTTVRCHLKPARVAIAKKTTKTFWRGCGEKGTLLCWWVCRLV